MANKVAPYPNELRTCIKLAGFSVRSVSKQTKIPESTLHDWAAGNRVIPYDERTVLADLLGCSIECLVPHIPISSLSSTSWLLVDRIRQLVEQYGLKRKA